MKKIGFIGLGRMGKAMVLQMLEKGADVVVYNRSREKTEELKQEISQMPSRIPTVQSGRGDPVGIFEKSRDCFVPPCGTRNDISCGKLITTYSIKELVDNLQSPRTIWIMVEHGKPVDDVIGELLSSGVSKGDIIIDGGNSFYKDSIRRFKELQEKSIHFVDIGTSGGLEGARNGACIMVGGEENVFNKLRPILETISTPGGVAYLGPAGAGHFVKMTHNGVEYGMLQAIGEGFEILKKGPYKLDLYNIANNWTHGSVVRGWLMELLGRALKNPKSKIQSPKQIQNPNDQKKNDEWLKEYSGSVGGGSTGEWTVETAEELGIDAPVIKGSYEARLKSQQKPTFAGKVISALRFQFGGHRD